MEENQDAKREVSEYFEVYENYNRMLRVWLVTFGIGGPVFILANEAVQIKLIAQENLNCVVVLFLIGVASQVFLAFTNKVVAWVIYDGKQCGRTSGWLYKKCDKLSEWFLIDIVLDVLTIGAFAWAVLLIANAFST